MPNIEQLRFAQRFPFSSLAKGIVKELDIQLDSVDEEILNRAAIIISHAFQGKGYVLEIKSRDLLEQEIAAFPIAKILVSLMKDPFIYKSFSATVARSTFLYLKNSPERKQLSLDLAKDLSLDFEVADAKGFFVSMPLQQYLSIPFNDPALKLVNQQLEEGRVFLNINLFCRFLGEIVFLKVLHSLPTETDALPASFKTFAKQLYQQLKKSQQLEFNFKVEGTVNPNAFPPCTASLYQRLLNGEQLPHMARFFLATFLNAVGMPQHQTLAVFKKSPDYDEKIASYQIKRIVEQNYAPASCEKIQSYGFCPSAECRVKHPLSYYRRQLKLLRGQKQKK